MVEVGDHSASLLGTAAQLGLFNALYWWADNVDGPQHLVYMQQQSRKGEGLCLPSRHVCALVSYTLTVGFSASQILAQHTIVERLDTT
jgi:hypothetical protein